MNWFLVTNIVGLAGSLLMLKYYHFKKYDFTFKTAAVVTFLIVCQSIVLYVILAAGKLQAVYLPIAFLVVIADIVFSIGLIFSEAGKRVWQKTGGIFFLIISVVQLSEGTGTLVVQDLNTKMMLQDVLKWTSVAYPLVSVFFIGNFISEVRSLKQERGPEKMSEVLYSGLGVGAFAALVALFFIGEKLLKENN